MVHMHIVPVVVGGHSIIVLLLSCGGGLHLGMLMRSMVVLLLVMDLRLVKP